MKLEQDGLLIGIVFHQVIKAQMDLTTSLFEQQDKDIEKLSKSSSRLEKLTYALIGLTVVLTVVTIIGSL